MSGAENSDCRYQEVGKLCEGMRRVSILKLRQKDLAYYSDASEMAGVWGFLNQDRKEIVAPKYIYAYDFSGGIAIVARGKWTIDPKWDNAYAKGKYWRESERWGGIDRKGREVIPCVFDEIRFVFAEGVYAAHYGGWATGRWGIIDQRGEWLAAPMFEDIGVDYHDGLFTFFTQDQCSAPEDLPMGIYDIKTQRVLFEPQFYCVNFRMDGRIEVEVFDAAQGKCVWKTIDRNGDEV